MRGVTKIYNGLGIIKFIYCYKHYVKISKDFTFISFYTDFQSLYIRLKDENFNKTTDPKLYIQGDWISIQNWLKIKYIPYAMDFDHRSIC